ncbi:hypothetical protein ONZ45_g12533 [Pleurotus djamor]|nr:hypothetical protein ONZ45_g12533 [Pleurotus djamor]
MNILSLPDELLLEIAYYNGLPTIKLLCCTNRRLHRALEPLIYCDVDLTHVATPRIQEFIENISNADHRKATFIHSLHLDYAFRFPAFDLLPNLRRLSVIEERGLPFTESWASLQTNSTLTHLVWLNQIFDEKAFASFLNAQPHLRYLKVENMGDYHGGPYHWAQFVSPNALGHLSTLSTCVRAAYVILPNRTIPHLELIFGNDDRGVFILPPECDSEVVQTLALSNSGRQELVLTALQFPNLQQLQVYPRFVSLPSLIRVVFKPSS